MSHKLTPTDAKAHIPRIILNQDIQKWIHGEGLLVRINTRLAIGITR